MYDRCNSLPKAELAEPSQMVWKSLYLSLIFRDRSLVFFEGINTHPGTGPWGH
jgi:hypothetical protein